MSLHEHVNINFILNNLNRELNKLEAEIEETMGTYTEVYNTPDTKNKLRIYEAIISGLYSSLKEFSSYWMRYCNTFNEAVIKEKDDTLMLSENYTKLYDKLQLLVDSFNNNNNNLIALYNGITELNNSNKEVLDTLDKASSSVIYSRATKKKGSSNPNYKMDIDTDTLIKDYISNNYRLTSEMCSKYNLTYQGIRNRLIERGIWRANK